MMLPKLTHILAILPLALAVPMDPSSVPVEAVSVPGAVSMYRPSQELGACGTLHKDDDLVAGVAVQRFGGTKACGKYIDVKGPTGKQVSVRVVTHCDACGYNDLKLSPKAFEKVVGRKTEGHFPVTWEWRN